MTLGPDSAALVWSVPIQTMHKASKKILPTGRQFARVRSTGLKRRRIGTDRYLILFDLAQSRPGDLPQDQPFDFAPPGMPFRFFFPSTLVRSILLRAGGAGLAFPGARAVRPVPALANFSRVCE